MFANTLVNAQNFKGGEKMQAKTIRTKDVFLPCKIKIVTFDGKDVITTSGFEGEPDEWDEETSG